MPKTRRKESTDGKIRSDQVRELTKQEKVEKDILAKLEELGGDSMNEESIERGGNTIRLPQEMELNEARDFLDSLAEDLEESTSFQENYPYRPWDGAWATWNVLNRVFGAVSHKGIMGWWGRNRPQLITVNSGPNSTEKVPWGAFFIPTLPDVEFELGIHHDDAGDLFSIRADGPRKRSAAIHGVFKMVREELRTNSLYRGKAFDGNVQPAFLDLTTVDRAKVVYSTESYESLKANVWTPIRHANHLRSLGMPRKRAVLLHGGWGTGKTLAAMLTAQIAVENGWTFIRARPGVDDLHVVMATAKLYAPCVVFFEDIDVISDPNRLEADEASRLLDSFDGIAAKGLDVLAVLTTNHIERIHKGMVRPGRLDAVIELGALDAPNTLRLLLANIPEGLVDEEDVRGNSVGVAEAHEGYSPAFVVESAGRAIRYAVSRATDEGVPPINADDLILSARGLRNQLKLMEGASEESTKPTLDAMLHKTVKDKLAEETPPAIDKAFADHLGR